MNRQTCITGIGTLAVVAVLTASAWADRTPMRRATGQREHGTRPDISVPYTTNGRTSFGVWQGVNPRVVVTPNVDDPKNPQSRPVYNLPFYGAVKVAGDQLQGATPRPAR